MRCPECNHENIDTAKFCGECGQRLQLVCDTCSALSPLGKKFCGDCGVAFQSPAAVVEDPQAAFVAGERRQLTVMFCDIVGYTKLSTKVDAEVLQQVVREYEAICSARVESYDGYVYQRVGDGIVVFFGYPHAHESEAERAVLAGLEIINALANTSIEGAGNLQVRIGIATGVVVISGTEIAAFGETMNLAARLQGEASPGTIVVSDEVKKLASGAFEYFELGLKTIKGIAQPIRLFQISGLSTAASRFDAASRGELTGLVGREQEIDLLIERWRQIAEGDGHVALLCGEPGIGKSRILSALRSEVEGHGIRAMRFQCSPFYSNTAFYPSIANFERTLAFRRDEPASSKLDRLERLLVDNYGIPREDVRYVATLLTIPHEDRYGEISHTPQKLKQETIRTLVDITVAASRKRPRLLIFEDAHWADATILEVLDVLVDRAEDLPLLIVITFRPEFSERWSNRGHVDLLNLSRLNRRQSEAMVRKIVHNKSLPPRLIQQIIEHTDGVPLFIEELTKDLLESGNLVELANRFDFVGQDNVINVPSTLRDSLMSRLDRNGRVKEIAQIGAVCGRSFTYELISKVAPFSRDELDEGLQQLTDSGLAVARGLPPDVIYTFKHALVQDAAYDSLLKAQRQELHGQIARALSDMPVSTARDEPELFAHHLTESGDLLQAIPLWLQAGARELAAMALEGSIRHLNKGLELVSQQGESLERDQLELALRRTLGIAWMAAKGWAAPEAREALTPALHLAHAATSGAEMLPVYWGLFSNTLSSGQVATSVDNAQDVLARVSTDGDSDLFITAHMMLLVSTFWAGDLVQCRSHVEAIREHYDVEQHRHIADELNHDPLTGAGIYGPLVTWMLGYPDQALAEYQASYAHIRNRGHVFDTCFALAAGADLFEYRSEPEIQLEKIEECETLGRESSLPVFSMLIGPMRRGAAFIRTGKFEDGVNLLRAGLDAREASGGFGGSNPYLKGLMAEGLAQLGRLDEALATLNEQIEQIQRPQWRERSHYAEILRLKGWVHSLMGEEDHAEAGYREALNQAVEQKAKSLELRAATSMARLWQSQGKTVEADDLLRPVYNWFTEGYATVDMLAAKSLLAELEA